MNSLSIRSCSQLVDAIQTGFKANYLYFWGHQADTHAHVTKACLSQWYPSAFVVDGVFYATAEHFMMAQKALLFQDRDSYAQVIASTDPAVAKKIGRGVKSFEQDIWLSQRWDIVVAANLHKFSQHQALKDFLLHTAPKILVEASPVDSIWGIGMDAHTAEISTVQDWKGLNLLGFALMEVRAQLGEIKND